jgi:DNA-binding transcriptional LysR family regulator
MIAMGSITLDMDTPGRFVTSIEAGSCARAAQQFGGPISAVSVQIKKPEEQAGVVLLPNF